VLLGSAAIGPRRRILPFLALVAALATVSCDSTPTFHSIIDKISGAPDSCHAQRQDLESYGNYFAQNMVVGAATGAAAATLIGVVTHQSVSTTVAMAVGAATIGAAAGYWESVSQKNTNMAARRQLVQTDVQAENQKVDGAQQAFNRLLDCRRKQAADLRADVSAGRVSHADGASQMDDIRKRYTDDVEIARHINANMADHAANLEYANEQLKPQPYVTTHATVVYASQSNTAAQVLTLKAQAVVSGAAIDKNWVKVTLSGGRTGYIQTSDVELQAERLAKDKKTRQAPPASTKGDPVAEGVFTNLSKRQDFDDSVQVASANSSGFELSGG